MKKVITFVLSLTVFTAMAQDKKTTSVKVKNPKTITTASGLEYTITEKGNGKTASAGDKVTVNYTGKLTNDTVFDSSIPRGQPFEFKLGAGQVIKGWDEAFALLQEGDKATIKLPPSIAYGDRAMGKIPANATLIFDIELLKVTEGLRPWSAKGKDTMKTPSGLKYIMYETHKDAPSCAASKVTVHYSGFFLDGKMFDSSVERGNPFTLKVGAGQVIPGWDEGLALLHKGDKAKLIIPYLLAYGEAGRPPVIPAKSDLVFDVEIVDVTAAVAALPYNIKGLKEETTASGIKYYVVSKSNNPAKAEAGKTVKVHYSGYLADGKMFDSSVERGEPIEFPLGRGQVIPGWEEGIALMNVGDKLRLVIPYFLAYGEQGRPPQIPAKADLTFDVELVDVH